MKASTDKGTDPKVIKFDACLADAFHFCNLRLFDVGKFTYVVVPLMENTSVLLCINLVLTMG